MRCVNILLPGVLAVAAAAGCYTGAHVDPNLVSDTPTATTTEGTDPASLATDLPCDVAALIAKNCGGCHGDPQRNGATNRIMTRDDLLAPESVGSDKTVADVALERMKDAKDPMPPAGLLADADVAILENWIGSGAKAATCADVIPAGANPYDTPSVCTSGATWEEGDEGSELMHPGKACIACHAAGKSNQRQKKPLYTIAGTVFPTAHEPDECNGAPSVTVEIKGADGKKTTLETNDAGNFLSQNTIKLPYTARLLGPGGLVREMVGKQTDGDCNGCHTESGDKIVPGRIMAPSKAATP